MTTVYWTIIRWKNRESSTSLFFSNCRKRPFDAISAVSVVFFFRENDRRKNAREHRVPVAFATQQKWRRGYNLFFQTALCENEGTRVRALLWYYILGKIIAPEIFRIWIAATVAHCCLELFKYKRIIRYYVVCTRDDGGKTLMVSENPAAEQNNSRSESRSDRRALRVSPVNCLLLVITVRTSDSRRTSPRGESEFKK